MVPPNPASLPVTPGLPLLLRDLIHDRIGVYFEPDRLDTMLDKLRDRALAHNCQSYLDYYYLLKYDDQGPLEWRRVMDAFSVQETYFWRELSQIRALVDVIVPTWFKTHTGPLRILSAACASGEEPYSLAIALCEAGWASASIEIFASDASEVALAKAQAGLYRERSFRALPLELRQKYFEPAGDTLRIRRNLLPAVTFKNANLVAASEIAELARADVIFCRNVFIYFSGEGIRRTVNIFAENMPDGGHLCIGASESLLKLTADFELREIQEAFVYVRKPRPVTPTP